MYIYIDKKNRIAYLSKSKKEIARETGTNYHSLDYYSRKKYYENDKLIFTNSNVMKSKQGGKREKQNNN